MRICLVLSFLFCSWISTIGQNTSPYNSLLWEITGNGLTEKSYLYGTMHVSRRIAFHLTDTFFLALNRCEMVALESNPDVWMNELLTNKDLWANEEDENIGFHYTQPSNFFESSFNYYQNDDDGLIGLLSSEPIHVNSLLYRSNSASQGDFEEDTWLDMFIYQSGKKLGKQIGGLEDFMTTVEMSKEADRMSKKESDEFYKKMRKSDKGEENLTEKLQDAYRNADLKMLDSLSKMGYSEKYTRIMINDRNMIMANTMDSIMKTKSLFAAMGAAHLPGNQGVIEILKAKGYILRPVYPLINKAEILKAKIEALSYPAVVETRISPDSTFSVDLPGKIYEGNAYNFGKEYFYPDMANGSYYTICEIGVPEEYSGTNRYIDKVDSLLFEYIPGKTTYKRKYLYNNQYPAIDLVTVNRRGNTERYQFLEFDDYLYMLKLSGTGTYAKQKKHDKFFESFKFIPSTSTQEWREMSYPENGYSFKMPGNTIEQKFDYSYNGEYRVVESMDTEGNRYLFMHNFFCDFEYIEEDSFELSFIANSFLKSVKYEIQDFAHILYKGLPGYKCTASNDAGKILHLFTSLKGADYYLMAVFGGDPPLPFFESLSYEAPLFTEDTEYQEDTTFFYTVNTTIPFIKPPKDNLFEETDEEEDPDEDESNMYVEVNATDLISKIKFFNCAETNEIIKLNIWTAAEYKSIADLDTLWKQEQRNLNFDGSLYIDHIVNTSLDSFDVLEYMAFDTNSTRAIRVKCLKAGRTFYELYSSIDTVYKSSTWLDNFYNTFKPIKYNASISITSLDTILYHIIHGDSTQKSVGLKMLNSHEFKDEDAPAFISFFNKIDPDSFNIYSRGNMISYIQDMNHPSIPAFLEKLYVDYTDTSELQFEILNTLLAKKNIDSYRLFIKLLKIESPVFSDYSTLSSLYGSLYDSVSLTLNILPELLDVSNYPEYKYAAFKLSAWLLNQHNISESVLKPHKDEFLEQASYHLKRLISRQLEAEDLDYPISLLNQSSDYEEDYPTQYYPIAVKHTTTPNDTIKSLVNYARLRENCCFDEDVHCYLDLLLPFYKEPKVKELFDKVSLIYPSKANLLTNIALVKHGYPVQDSIWKYYVKNEKSRILTYELVSLINRQDLFDTTMLHQENFAKSYLLNKIYENKDSIVLLKTENINTGSGNGLVYFFYIYDNEKKDLGWVAYKGVESDLSQQPFMINYNTSYGNDEETDLNDQMEKVKASFLKKNRKRLNQYTNEY